MSKNSVRQTFTENTKFDIVDRDIMRWEDDGGSVQAESEYDDRVGVGWAASSKTNKKIMLRQELRHKKRIRQVQLSFNHDDMSHTLFWIISTVYDHVIPM